MNIFANKAVKILSVIYIIAIMIWIFSSVSIRDYADDLAFSHALDKVDYWKFISERYFSWSGRVIIDSVTALTINAHIFWKIMIPLSFLILSVSLAKNAREGSDVRHYAIMMSLLLIIPPGINEDSAWWVTGFYNYLLPTAMATYAIYAVRRYHSGFKIFFAILAAVIACDSEQVGLAFLLTLSVWIFLNKKYTTKNVTILLLSMAKFASLVLAPGNANRTARETYFRMPEYPDLTIQHKLMTGLDRLYGAVTMECAYNFIILIILSVIIIVISKRKNINIYFSIFVIFSSLAYLLSIRLGLHSLGLQNFDDLRYQPFSYLSFPLVYGLVIACLLCVAYVIYHIAPLQGGASVFILAGALTVVAIGVSPTAYASGFRVLYVFEVSVSYFIFCLISEIKVIKFRLGVRG